MHRTHTSVGRVAAVLTVFVGLAVLGPNPAGSQSNEPLLHQSDLQYLGAFRVPQGSSDQTSFGYGGTAPAYNSANNSLFLVGHDWYQLTAEVTIPTPVNSTSLSALKTATILQPFADATNGLLNQTGGTQNKIGGQLVYGGRLYGTVYIYYDAADVQVLSHWVRPSTGLTAGTAQGLFQVGAIGAGFVSGYMAPIPAEWQASFGGPALTGNCCLSIIGRTSFGPAVSVFDPADLGVKNPVPTTPVLYYDGAHPTLGPWNGSWNGTTEVFNSTTNSGGNGRVGLVFPEGTRSVLFFAQQGIGTFCYGSGGASGGDCYDPDYSWKGNHAYPYTYAVWAYDANDLLAVKNGQKQPWQPVPYAVWTFSLPFGTGYLNGAAWDPATRRIYLSQGHADGIGANPVIHVFQVAQGATAPPEAPPAAPTNLRVQ